MLVMNCKTASSQAGIRRLREQAPAAISRALNKSIASARTNLASSTAKDMRLKVGTVKDLITIRDAKPGQEVASLVASAKRIPAIEFTPVTGPEPSRGKGRGVRARLPGAPFRHGFIATMRSGHRGIFERRPAAGRLPIAELKGPSVFHVAEAHVADAAARGLEQLQKNLKHEIGRVLKQT